MNLDEYQKRAKKYDLKKGNKQLLSVDFMSKVLGLSGETGEVIEKFKKVLRDGGGEVDGVAREAILSEMGDVLWYLAMIAWYLEADFSEVAEKNLEKLESRLQRGKLSGSGDKR